MIVQLRIFNVGESWRKAMSTGNSHVAFTLMPLLVIATPACLHSTNSRGTKMRSATHFQLYQFDAMGD